MLVAGAETECLLRCPVCKKPLYAQATRFICPQAHSFDRARQGYVNLLQSQQSSKRNHGDDRLMIEARRRFLDTGHYLPLQRVLIDAVYFYTAPDGVIIDAGCGECWYTAAIAEKMPRARILGFDISKYALKWAAHRGHAPLLAVASCFAMPVADACANSVLNIFSPLAAGEYARVLKPGGHLFRVVPGEKHLWELKQAVYDTPHPNRPEKQELEGFRLLECRFIAREMELRSGEEIQALFQMTPYYYRTAAKDRERIEALAELKTHMEFQLLIYERLR